MDKGHAKSRSHGTILTLYLTTLKFNGLLTMGFFPFSNSIHWRVKVQSACMVPNHLGIRLWKELHLTTLELHWRKLFTYRVCLYRERIPCFVNFHFSYRDELYILASPIGNQEKSVYFFNSSLYFSFFHRKSSKISLFLHLRKKKKKRCHTTRYSSMIILIPTAGFSACP